ncbi:MAG: hypothetical protein SOI56_02380 [Eubacteriales bacterium]|jgi:hypothetical protein
MTTKEYTKRMQERNQKIMLCAATYFNLNGYMPDKDTLCEMLGNDYAADVIRYLGRSSVATAGVA